MTYGPLEPVDVVTEVKWFFFTPVSNTQTLSWMMSIHSLEVNNLKRKIGHSYQK